MYGPCYRVRVASNKPSGNQMEIKMKRLTIATIATLTIATSASAGVCSWIDNVDIAGSAKGSAVLSAGATLVTTKNPAVSVVNGVVVGVIVGGSFYAVDYTCDIFQGQDVVSKTSEIANKTYKKASEYATKSYSAASDYATNSYEYFNNWWNKESV